MNDRDALTPTQREQMWNTIARVRDGAPRRPDDADTDDIIDAIIDSGLFAAVAEAARACIGVTAGEEVSQTEDRVRHDSDTAPPVRIGALVGLGWPLAAVALMLYGLGKSLTWTSRRLVRRRLWAVEVRRDIARRERDLGIGDSR